MRALFIISLCFFSLYGNSQNSFETTIKDRETEEPLIGATVYFPELVRGRSSNMQGKVFIGNIPDGNHKIQISYIGYVDKVVAISFPLSGNNTFSVIYLDSDEEEMEEVVITSTRSSRTIEDIPTRVEFIAGEELSEKGNMKPGDIRMLLNESTGIQTQQTSATSYNSSIRIQGLDGKYTQLLRDGLPLYSGFSGGLSLMQIAPLDLKQVEVIKGASSTLYGGGAIAGLVNLISKSPEEEREISFMANGTSALGLDLSGFYAEKFDKTGTTVFASYNKGTPYDPANIGLTAIPNFERLTLNPKMFLYPNDKTEMIIGLNFVTEERLGGNIDYIKGKQVSNPYYERNNTNRISSQLQIRRQIKENSRLEFKNTVGLFDRKLETPEFDFIGKQLSSFTELNYVNSSEKTEWVAGSNLWTDQFSHIVQTHNYKNFTWGNFLQNTWNLHENTALESGIRVDYHSEYGWFLLPRITALYHPVRNFTIRVGGGLGYKTPTVFTEEAERLQFENVAPINLNDVNPEKSGGFNLDINYKIAFNKHLFLSSNLMVFYTRINDPLSLETDEFLNYSFKQTYDFFDTKGIEVNLKLEYDDLKLFTGYTLADVNKYGNGTKLTLPLVAKNRLNNVLMYEKEENFWIGLEAYYFSPQSLSDGSTGKSYWIFGLMTEKQFGERFSLFINLENFTDTRQTRFDTIFTGTLENPDFRDIYAPVDGFVVNGGFKIKF